MDDRIFSARKVKRVLTKHFDFDQERWAELNVRYQRLGRTEKTVPDYITSPHVLFAVKDYYHGHRDLTRLQSDLAGMPPSACKALIRRYEKFHLELDPE